jgi:hypothetical protein
MKRGIERRWILIWYLDCLKNVGRKLEGLSSYSLIGRLFDVSNVSSHVFYSENSSIIRLDIRLYIYIRFD